jgi:hypothetical protein
VQKRKQDRGYQLERNRIMRQKERVNIKTGTEKYRECQRDRR